MARPRKDRKRATGIQCKKGYLYIVISHTFIKDGEKKTKKQWIPTRLTDTPENVKKASAERLRLLNNLDEAIDINISLSDFIDYVLSKKKREVSDTTYSGYFYRAKRIKEYFGDIKVREVNIKTVESFLDSLFETHQIQPRTAKDIKIFLGNVLEQAVRKGIIPYNPVKDVALNKTLATKYSKEKNIDEKFFSYEEAQLFLSKVKDHELYELFYVTLFFGLRREEVLGLEWSAIDFQEPAMYIKHTVTKGMTVNRSNTTKTVSSARKYPLTAEQVELFQQLRRKERANRKLCGNDYFDSNYIFKHADGTLYYPDYPTKAFRKLIKKIPELPQGITFHGLRSSCVSILLHQGIGFKSIQKWVGHADIDTTLRIYAKVKDTEAKQEISTVMNDMFSLKDYEVDQ